MINIEQVLTNKDAVLQNNVLPNVCWNRFDLRYKNDYELWKIDNVYFASHLDCDTINISLYLREMDANVFQEFAKYLFEFYPSAKNLWLLHTYTTINRIEPAVHWHIDLPQTVEAFDETLSHRVRYNTKWYPKKIREKFGEYKIEYIDAQNCPDDVVLQYFQWKNQTHGTNYGLSPKQYLEKFCVTGVYVMKTDSEMLAIGFISETNENVFFENFSYNQEYAKYSPGMVLYHHLISDLIAKNKKKLYLLGGNLEYKKHFNGIATMTRTGMLPREQFICPRWIAVLAKMTPSFLRKFVITLLPHSRHKRAFDAQCRK